MWKTRLLAVLVIFSLAVISYAALPLLADAASSSGGDPGVSRYICCTTGWECPEGYACVAPRPNEADCSQYRPNYCRDQSPIDF